MGAQNAGGAGGSTGTGAGLIVFAGGNGSAGNNGTSGTTGVTGNGGGGAGSGSNGTSPAATCGVTGFGGTGTYPGGNGGVSTSCAAASADASSAPGLQPGGGGSGVKNWLTVVLTGGAGGAGRVVIETNPGLWCGTCQSTHFPGADTSRFCSHQWQFYCCCRCRRLFNCKIHQVPLQQHLLMEQHIVRAEVFNPGTVVAGGSGAASFSATGLSQSTAYDFYVYSMNTGCSGPLYNATALSGTSSTAASPLSTALGGLWSSPQTWANGVVPPAGEDVTIVAGSIVTVDQAVTITNLTIDGTLQWNATANALTVTGNLIVNSGGKFYPFTTGQAGVAISIAGNYTNNGYANHALTMASGFHLNFNGSGSTLSGSGVFEGDGTNGIIRSLAFQNLGSNTISTTQNLVVNGTTGGLNAFALTASLIQYERKIEN